MNQTWKPVIGYEGMYEVGDHGSAKLDESKVRKIWSMIFEGHPIQDIADWAEVSPETIREIRNGIKWKHVLPEGTNSVFLRKEPILIKGDSFIDDRGVLSYVNDMNFFGVQRVYWIHHDRYGVVRAWHGHHQEGKFVYVVKGIFLVGAVHMKTEKIHTFVLSEQKPAFLWIPPGYANGFKNLKEDSDIMFLSTSTIEEAKGDDVRFEWNKWNIWDEHFR